jgi:spore coat polysaccharide biosynthesis protein SpsF (cytidylyltransferase family)
MIGINLSDGEETPGPKDVEYEDMAALKDRANNRKTRRRDSDSSVNTAYLRRRDDIYKVSFFQTPIK